MDDFPLLTLLGVFLILVGLVLIALSLLAKHIPNPEDTPYV